MLAFQNLTAPPPHPSPLRGGWPFAVAKGREEDLSLQAPLPAGQRPSTFPARGKDGARSASRFNTSDVR